LRRAVQGSDPARVLKSRSSFHPWLSTPLEKALRGHRKGSRVASTDDIHKPVEKPRNNKRQHDEGEKPAAAAPGQFISNDLERATTRFVEEVKGLALRRKKRAAEERQGPPPPAAG
jgi:hypothetical protein